MMRRGRRATTRAPAVAPRFRQVREDHAEVLAAVDRIAAKLRVPAAAATPRGAGPLIRMLDELLDFHERRLEPHMTGEERDLYPLLDQHLPCETGSAETMTREHETIRYIVSLIRTGRERLTSGVPDAESEVVVALQDLTLLLRDHIRKEDAVIFPILERLLGQEA